MHVFHQGWQCSAHVCHLIWFYTESISVNQSALWSDKYCKAGHTFYLGKQLVSCLFNQKFKGHMMAHTCTNVKKINSRLSPVLFFCQKWHFVLIFLAKFVFKDKKLLYPFIHSCLRVYPFSINKPDLFHANLHLNKNLNAFGYKAHFIQHLKKW